MIPSLIVNSLFTKILTFIRQDQSWTSKTFDNNNMTTNNNANIISKFITVIHSQKFMFCFFTYIHAFALSLFHYFIDQVVSDVLAGLLQTLMYTIRISLAYVVMLSVMSMNGGVFLVAVGGHTVGYMLFGSRVFRKSAISESEDLPPLTCC